MPCFAGKLERERAELRELLETAQAQREDFRRAGEHTRTRLDATQAQLDARTRELSQQAAALRRQEEATSQAQARGARLEEQLAAAEGAAAAAEAGQAELRGQLARVASERDASLAEERKLTKEREYLRQRVDRMQQALSMLESVLDDTLGDPSLLSGAERASVRERSNALRQSKENIGEVLSSLRLRGAEGIGASSGTGRYGVSIDDQLEDQRSY